MRDLSVNFQELGKNWDWLGFLLLGLGLVSLVYWYLSYVNTEENIVDIKTKLEQHSNAKQNKLVDNPIIKVDEKLKDELYKTINKSLMVPWPKLFSALERSKPDDVMLLGVLPDATARTLQLTGNAGGLETVISYVQKLQQQHLFKNVNLRSHQLNQSSGSLTVYFEIEAIW